MAARPAGATRPGPDPDEPGTETGSLIMGVVFVFVVLFLLTEGARLRGDIDVETDIPAEQQTESNPQLVEASSTKLGANLPPIVSVPGSSGSGPGLVAPAGRAAIQPVYPNDDQNGDDVGGVLPPGISYPGGGSDEPKDKLDLALDAVSEDIIAKSKQISEENKWVTDVKTILQTYNTKVLRVDSNINKLRHQVKDLYQKKKQIENLKLQKILQLKLADAHDDLSKMQSALLHVKSKASEILQSKEDIQKTINGIESELTELKGDDKDKARDNTPEKDPNAEPKETE